MRLYADNNSFKKMIIIFWTLWWLIALWTDVVGGLAHLGCLKASWAPDTNYPELVQALEMYHFPTWVHAGLFIGILLMTSLSTALFCWTSFGLMNEQSIWMKRAQYAFIVSLCFWFAFYLADQFVMKFDLEQNHMVQGGFQLLTFLALYLLPESMSRD